MNMFARGDLAGPFLKALLWSFIFAAASVLSTFALGLILGLVFADKRIKGRKIYQSLHDPALRLPGLPGHPGVEGHAQQGLRLHQRRAPRRRAHSVAHGRNAGEVLDPGREPVARASPTCSSVLPGCPAVSAGRRRRGREDRRRLWPAHRVVHQAARCVLQSTVAAADRLLCVQLQQLLAHLHVDRRWPELPGPGCRPD